MTKLRCIAVDDEPLALDIIEDYVSKVPYLELVKRTENAIEALQMVQAGGIDLVFLDIQMPELTGINFMKIVGGKIKYVLTTAYSEYALEGYEHNIVDYLLKPISFERFNKSALKVQERFAVKGNSDAYFFVKSSGQQHRINFDEILYIESIKDYVNIRTIYQEYIILDSLKSLEQELPKSSFIRIHKSFMINLHQIKSIGTKKILLLSEQEIPIGDSYRANLLNGLK